MKAGGKKRELDIMRLIYFVMNSEQEYRKKERKQKKIAEFFNKKLHTFPLVKFHYYSFQPINYDG